MAVQVYIVLESPADRCALWGRGAVEDCRLSDSLSVRLSVPLFDRQDTHSAQLIIVFSERR